MSAFRHFRLWSSYYWSVSENLAMIDFMPKTLPPRLPDMSARTSPIIWSGNVISTDIKGSNRHGYDSFKSCFMSWEAACLNISGFRDLIFDHLPSIILTRVFTIGYPIRLPLIRLSSIASRIAITHSTGRLSNDLNISIVAPAAVSLLFYRLLPVSYSSPSSLTRSETGYKFSKSKLMLFSARLENSSEDC